MKLDTVVDLKTTHMPVIIYWLYDTTAKYTYAL